MRISMICAAGLLLVGCMQSQVQPVKKYTLQDTTSVPLVQQAQSQVVARHIVARPGFSLEIASNIAKDFCKRSQGVSVVAAKVSVQDAKAALPKFMSSVYTPDSDLYKATITGDVVWPFVDHLTLINKSDYENFKGNKMDVLISPDDDRVVYAFLYRKQS